MTDAVGIATIAALLYEGFLAGLRLVGEKVAEKAVDKALSPVEETVEAKVSALLNKERQVLFVSFKSAVERTIVKFKQRYGDEEQSALLLLLGSRHENEVTFAEALSDLYILHDYPDFKKIESLYLLATRTETGRLGVTPLPWSEFSEPLSTFFYDLKVSLRDDPQFRPILDSRALFDVNRLMSALTEGALSPEVGIYTRPARESYNLETLHQYLDYVIRENQFVDPRGIPQVATQVVLRLEEVYVALQADQESAADFNADRRMLDEELQERAASHKLSEKELRELKYRIWAKYSRKLNTRKTEVLEQAIGCHQRTVILGDPGAGKTTLLRYLALRCARDLKEGRFLIKGLGPVRLPILVRVAHFAEARQRNPDLALESYLSTYFEGHGVNSLAPLFADYLRQGRCLVLLDGLDEIVNQRDRALIASAIQRFVRSFAKDSSEAYPAEGLSIMSENLSSKAVVQGEALETSDLVQGNQFVVTSRIAGYRISPLSAEFAHYRIREMNNEQIRVFLEKWCLAVESHLTNGVTTVKEEATAEALALLSAIEGNPGVRRMAANPLMLTILALIHRNMTDLPQRRVELYDLATRTLLEKWNPRVRGVDVVIREHDALSLLGPVAFWMHETSPSGLAFRADVEAQMQRHLSLRRGLDPEHPTLEVHREVSDFLDRVREFSGIFVERGEGLYGFMHLTFEEYFAARWLVANPNSAIRTIRNYLHQPRWREPILLGIGYLSGAFFADYPSSLVESILSAGSKYEDVLHRDKLFAAACLADSVYIIEPLQQRIISELIVIYCDYKERGRYKSLQKQIEASLAALGRGPCEWVLEAEIIRALSSSESQNQLRAAQLIKVLDLGRKGIIRSLLGIAQEEGGEFAEDVLRHLRLNHSSVIDDAGGASVFAKICTQDPLVLELLSALASNFNFASFLDAVFGLKRVEVSTALVGSVLAEAEQHLAAAAAATADPEHQQKVKNLQRKLTYFGSHVQRVGAGKLGDQEIESLIAAAEVSDEPAYEILRGLQLPSGDVISLVNRIVDESPLSSLLMLLLQRFKAKAVDSSVVDIFLQELAATLSQSLEQETGKLWRDAAKGLYALRQGRLERLLLRYLKSRSAILCARGLLVVTASWYRRDPPDLTLLIEAWHQCNKEDRVRLLPLLIKKFGYTGETLHLLFSLLGSEDIDLKEGADSLFQVMRPVEINCGILDCVASFLPNDEEDSSQGLKVLSCLRGKKANLDLSWLRLCLESPSLDRRLWAAIILAESFATSPEVCQLLTDALRDGRDEVRDRASWVVQNCIPDASAKDEVESWLRLCKEQGNSGWVQGRLHDRLFSMPYGESLVADWFDDLRSEDDSARDLASMGLGFIRRVLDGVVTLVCEEARRGDKRTLRAAVMVLWSLQKESPEVAEALRVLLHSADDSALREAACAALGRLQSVGIVNILALRSALEDNSAEVRRRAAWFLGKVYQKVRESAAKRLTKEDIRSKLFLALPFGEDNALNRLFRQPMFESVAEADGGAVLDLLGRLAELDADGEDVIILLKSQKLQGLVVGLLADIKERSQRLEILPDILSSLVVCLEDENGDVNEAAAAALARIKQGEADLFGFLRSHLVDDRKIIKALIDSASDMDDWGRLHDNIIKSVINLIEEAPILIEEILEYAERLNRNDPGDWNTLRPLMAVMAELGERLPGLVEANRRSSEFLDCLVRTAQQQGSFRARGLAIKALGNLRQATPEVIEVIFKACRDTSSVYEYAVEAARKFRIIEPYALGLLSDALSDPSLKVRQNAADMLAEVGAFNEELSSLASQSLYEALGRVVNSPDSDKGVQLFDAVYDAIVKVVG